MLSFIFMPWILLMYSISTCNTPHFSSQIFPMIPTMHTVLAPISITTMSKTDTQAAAKKISTKAKKPKWDKNE